MTASGRWVRHFGSQDSVKRILPLITALVVLLRCWSTVHLNQLRLIGQSLRETDLFMLFYVPEYKEYDWNLALIQIMSHVPQGCIIYRFKTQSDEMWWRTAFGRLGSTVLADEAPHHTMIVLCHAR
jgi:hypothetical protein